jgi:nicotinamide-nucleotide amidase
VRLPVVEVINTGTELLLGTVINAHLAYFGQSLFPLGLRVGRQVAVPDGEAIRGAIEESFGRADIVLVTGGLGPTADDITREITAELFDVELRRDESVLNYIVKRCVRRGIPFVERMGRQAMVPEGAVVLLNAFGTAPGLYFRATGDEGGRTPHLFLLPGPPRELKPMFESEVLPVLREIALEIAAVECRTFRCVGLGESMIEERIGSRIATMGGIEVGYCARPNEVDFRLIGTKTDLDAIEPAVREAIGDHLVTTSNERLEEVVVKRLAERDETVATAESCTGGLLANRITNVPGASAVFLEGWVTYANDAKTRDLGVDSELIDRYGAVSEEVARAMAEGALGRAATSYALATTGIAGPDGGTAEKPVGTVFMALAGKHGPTEVARHCFATDRETFKQLTTQTLLDMLRRRIG